MVVHSEQTEWSLTRKERDEWKARALSAEDTLASWQGRTHTAEALVDKHGIQSQKAWDANKKLEVKCEKLEVVVIASQAMWDCRYQAAGNSTARQCMTDLGKTLAALKGSE